MREDLTVAPFIVSSFGLFVMGLFAGLFTTPSWHTFTVLAYGWTMAGGDAADDYHVLWLSGATEEKHWSCFYRFLGGALYYGALVALGADHPRAAQWVPATEPIRVVVDDSSKKKAGRQIEGGAYYRNGAGSGPARISDVVGAQLCVGDHACAAAGLAQA